MYQIPQHENDTAVAVLVEDLAQTLAALDSELPIAREFLQAVRAALRSADLDDTYGIGVRPN